MFPPENSSSLPLWDKILRFSMFACVLWNHSASAAVENAKAADAFVDSIGVCVHLSYTDCAEGNYTDFVKPKLLKLGVRHIRDGISGTSSTLLNYYKDLATQSPPIRSSLILTPTNAVSVATTLGSVLELVEGPNEVDSKKTPLVYGTCAHFPTSAQATQQYQGDLYSAVRSYSQTLPVIAPSFTQNGYTITGTLPGEYGNIHDYAKGEPGAAIDLNCQWVPLVTGGYKPVIATETGYSTWNPDVSGSNADTFPENIDPTTAAHAKYIPRTVFEHFRRGIFRTYIYQLLDLWSNTNTSLSGTCRESHFGLVAVSASGTGSNVTLTEKPAYTALMNTISILNDPGTSFTPGSLGVTISGTNNMNLRHVLLQKADGSYWLALWQNAPSCTVSQWPNTDITVASQPVTITLDRAFTSASYFHPSVSGSSLSFPSGVTISASTGTITALPVPDEVILVKFTGIAQTYPSVINVAVTGFGSGEGMLTSNTSVSYNTAGYNLCTAMNADYGDEKIGDAGTVQAYRACVKFDLPPLSANNVVTSATMQLYLRALSGAPAGCLHMVSFQPDEAPLRATDWDDENGLCDIGNIATSGTAAGSGTSATPLGVITISSNNYPNLAACIRDAYVKGLNYVSFRFQLDQGLYITGTDSTADYYDIGSSKNNIVSMRPSLTLVSGTPSTITLRSGTSSAQDGLALASSPFSSGLSMTTGYPSTRVGDDTSNRAYQGYIKFPLSAIPAGKQITGARFGYYFINKTGTPTHNVALESYESGSGSLTISDWSGQNYTTSIGDILTTTDAIGTAWVAENPVLTEAVNAAYKRGTSFLGLRLRLSGGAYNTGSTSTYDYYLFGTAENPDLAKQPYLQVDYQ